MIGLSPLQQAEVVLSGYRDCAAEAIRYLLEVEHLLPEDPLVQGLQNHLYEKQKHLDFVHILLQCQDNTMCQNELTSLDDSGITEDGHDSSDSVTMEIIENDAVAVTHSSNIQLTSSDIDCENNSAITALAEEILSLIEEENVLNDTEKEDDDNEQ